MRTETELDKDFEYRDDPEHTKHLLRMIKSGVAIAFFLSIGLIFIGVNFGHHIDSFFRTKTGFWTLVGVVTIPGITWAIMKVRAMIQEK